MLDEHFSKCSTYSTSPLVPSDFQPELCPSDCPTDLLCTVGEVWHLLHKLDVAKSSGPDGISARMLKSTAHSIAPSLTQLFNLSLQSGTVPRDCNTSSIVPIPKDRDRATPTNYRPMSLLSTVSKIMERHIHSKIHQ